MKKVLFVGGATLCMYAGLSRAETFYDSGTSCRVSVTSVASQSSVRWGDQGMSNTDTSQTARIICPVDWDGDEAAIAGNTTVHYRDLNNDNALNGSLYCYMVATEMDGGAWIGAARYSCATAGGCASSSPTFTSTGSSYLSVTGLEMEDESYAAYVMYCVLPDGDGAPSVPSGVLGYHTDID